MGIHLMSQTCLPEVEGRDPLWFPPEFLGEGPPGRELGLGSVERGGQRDWVRRSLWPRTHLCCPLEPMVATPADPPGLPAGKNGAEGRLIARTQSWCLRTPYPQIQPVMLSTVISTDGSPKEAEGPTCPV